MAVLDPEVKKQVTQATNEEAIAILAGLSPSEFATTAFCTHHQRMCPLSTDVDLEVFGAPCIDDSTWGKSMQDDGEARKAARLTECGAPANGCAMLSNSQVMSVLVNCRGNVHSY